MRSDNLAERDQYITIGPIKYCSAAYEPGRKGTSPNRGKRCRHAQASCCTEALGAWDGGPKITGQYRGTQPQGRGVWRGTVR